MQTREILDIYYPGLILFAVFTFANDLLKKLVFSFSTEIMLLTVLWFALIIQISIAYARGLKHKEREHPILALIASLLELLCVIFMCSIMGGYKETALPNYLYLSIPFLVIALSQFLWFISLRLNDPPAFFRLIILFSGMIFITVSEVICHNIWNLALIVALVVLLGILRVINKAPIGFEKKVKIFSHIEKRLAESETSVPPQKQ